MFNVAKRSKAGENVSICGISSKEAKESEVYNHNKVLMAFAALKFTNVYNNGFFTLAKFVAENVGISRLGYDTYTCIGLLWGHITKSQL